MRTYWDGNARRNAAWYVDTSLGWDAPDMEAFFETGRNIVEALVDGAPVAPTGRAMAIEIGSGLGRVCVPLADRFERVVGVDVSPEMVQRASQLVSDPRISFRVGNGMGLPSVDDETVDLVVSFTVFQHVPETSIVHDYLAEAGRVLRPGGLLAFQWNNERGARRWAARRAVLSALQRTGLHRERYDRHAREFLGVRIPLAPLQRTLSEHGLELVGTEGLGTLYAMAWAVRRPEPDGLTARSGG
jgi:SAM-dependent methyltransferase